MAVHHKSARGDVTWFIAWARVRRPTFAWPGIWWTWQAGGGRKDESEGGASIGSRASGRRGQEGSGALSLARFLGGFGERAGFGGQDVASTVPQFGWGEGRRGLLFFFSSSIGLGRAWVFAPCSFLPWTAKLGARARTRSRGRPNRKCWDRVT